MIPNGLKESLVPGSLTFLLFAALPGVVLLFRRRDGGRLGKIWLTGLLLTYWGLSTPIAAVALVNALAPDVRAIQTPDDARGAGAIVVLGGGMDVHRSRGAFYGAPTREGALRVLEAARVSRVLDGIPIVVSGGPGWATYSAADLMADQLVHLGVPPDRIVKDEQSTNTRDHARFIPPLLKGRGVTRFVLVTSKQHIARSLAVFRAAGVDPIPSTPEVFGRSGRPLEMYLPSRVALSASHGILYEVPARVYYRWRGWTR